MGISIEMIMFSFNCAGLLGPKIGGSNSITPRLCMPEYKKYCPNSPFSNNLPAYRLHFTSLNTRVQRLKAGLLRLDSYCQGLFHLFSRVAHPYNPANGCVVAFITRRNGYQHQIMLFDGAKSRARRIGRELGPEATIVSMPVPSLPARRMAASISAATARSVTPAWTVSIAA